MTVISLEQAERQHAAAERPSPAAEIARLAALPALEYDRERDAAAKLLGCRASTLDNEVKRARTVDAPTGGQGRKLELADPDPWHEPVDGNRLLAELHATIRRYVALPEAAAVATTLWIVHTHAFTASSITPRLAITSPEKRCGKSTLLRLVGALVARSLSTASITAPALFRSVELARPTLLIDEADTFLAQSEELRGIINAGHGRDGAVIRVVGEDLEPHAFSCWAPVAIAAIGKLPGTIEDRSVMIAMRRRTAGEEVVRLRLDRLDMFDGIKRRCARWVADNTLTLVEADPDVPGCLNDRASDNWRPLLAIADTAGGDWPASARAAALALNDMEEDEESSVRTMLLTDIRDMFAEKHYDRIASADLADHLGTLEHRPWPEWVKGRPITARQVARLLAPFKIAPSSVRIGTATPKGYMREQFADAFSRYLPIEPQQRHTQGNPPVSAPIQSATDLTALRIETIEKPKETAVCGVVADKKGENGKAWEARI